VHLRGRENILKRLVVHAGAANLGLLMRKMFGAGTPKSLQARIGGAFSAVIRVNGALRAIWPSAIVHLVILIHRRSFSVITCPFPAAA